MDAGEIIGKAVVSKDGFHVGRVAAIHLDPEGLTVEGITIRRGFMAETEYVGREYLDSINAGGVVLGIVPVTEMVGMPVYDARGEKVGEVKAVDRNRESNTLKAIEVSRGWFKKALIVPKAAIRRLGNGVMLNIPVRG